MLANQEARLIGGVAGWHAKIVGSLLSVTGTPATTDIAGPGNNNVGVISALAGVALAAGTYYFAIPVAGCSAVDVVLRTSAGGANITAASTKIYKTMVDGVTEKMGATGSSAAVASASFVDATQQTISITTLRGERSILFKLVVTGAGATFDQAEFSAL